MDLLKNQIPLNGKPEKISELSHKGKISLKWSVLCSPMCSALNDLFLKQ